jgi:hypothetical protein
MDTFYTYMWLRYDGTPYYIGKSKGTYRAYGCKHTVPMPKNPDNILLQEWPCEADALEAERFFISYYGRKDIGTGILRNLTDGGEGHSDPSPETRQKLSTAMKGNLNCLNRQQPADEREKRSKSLKAHYAVSPYTFADDSLRKQRAEDCGARFRGKPWSEARRLAQAKRKESL